RTPTESERYLTSQAALDGSTTVPYSDLEVPPGWTVMGRDDLSKIEPVQPLIEHTISFPATTLVVGEAGVGKTSLVLGWACSVAVGRPWMGFPVDQDKRRALWVVGEGPNALDKRVAAWESRYFDGERVSGDRLKFCVKPPDLLKDPAWDFLADVA